MVEKTITYKSKFEVGDKVYTHWTQDPLIYSDEACPIEYRSCVKKPYDSYVLIGVIVRCGFYRDSFFYLVEFPTGDRLWVREDEMKNY